jgi:hypothetical protein
MVVRYRQGITYSCVAKSQSARKNAKFCSGTIPLCKKQGPSCFYGKTSGVWENALLHTNLAFSPTLTPSSHTNYNS